MRLVVTLLLMLFTSAGYCSEKLLEECARKTGERGRQFASCWFRYTARDVKDANLYPSKAKAKGKAFFDATMEYAVKGAKRRSWGKVIRSSNPMSEWKSENGFIYNGEIWITKRGAENNYQISRNERPPAIWFGPPLEICGDARLHTMSEWFFKPDVIGRKATHDIGADGEARINVECFYLKTKWRDRFQISPSHGWAAERFESYAANDELAYRQTTLEWATVDGVDYPKRCRQEGPYDASGKPRWTIDIEVSSLVLQASKIPDSLFQFDFPKDAIIFDADKQIAVRNSDVAQTHLDEVVRRAAKPRWTWLGILFWPGSALLLLLAAGYGYRMHLRRVAAR